MERLTGTRYSYEKTRVAYLVPFVFIIPGALVMLLIYVLSSRMLITGGIFNIFPTSVKILLGVLILMGGFVAADLWRTFRRVLNEEIWITDREIVWIGPGRKVLVQAPHYDIQRLIRHGRHDDGWLYSIVTSAGRIKFTRAIKGADELIARIEAFTQSKP